MANFDVIVIGCGPAGQKAAIKCGKLGKRVAVVDSRQVVGGQCLHVGTIPSKSLREAIIYLSGYNERKIYGPDFKVKQDITIDDLLTRCRSIIGREIAVIHEQLVRNSVNVFQGHASFVDEHTVRITGTVGTDEHTADYIIVATGTVPHMLQDICFDSVHVMNTDDILHLQFLPDRLIMIGGGVIGIEYASMLSMLDMEVHLVTQYTSLLPWIDRDLMTALMEHMTNRGVVFHLGRHLEDIHLTDNDTVVGRFEETGEKLEANMLLYAAQRWGNTKSLNLQSAGLDVIDRDFMSVNNKYQTSVPHIYAVGDVIGFPSLASTSIDQGRKAANHLLKVSDVPYDPLFPYGLYTFPDISMIGQDERELQKAGITYEKGIGYYRDTARGQIIGDDSGMIKLLFDPADHTLLGVHIIGSDATELIHIGQSVLINGGKIDYFIDTVFNYPTLAEVYKLAALNGFNKLDAARPVDHL